MKKALIAIISTIYLIAIVIVSFLGISASVDYETVYVEQIVLDNQDDYIPGVPKSEESRLTRVYKRPAESEINENGVGINDRVNWNFEDKRRDYAIFIDNYAYIYDNQGGNYIIKTSVIPEDATEKELSFYISGSENVTKYIEGTDYGAEGYSLKITSQHKGWIDVDILVTSTDLSTAPGASIDTLLKIGSYI